MPRSRAGARCGRRCHRFCCGVFLQCGVACEEWEAWAAVGLLAGLSRVCRVRIACESRPALLDSVRLSGKKACVCEWEGIVRSLGLPPGILFRFIFPQQH